jgi:hypothetical protein
MTASRVVFNRGTGTTSTDYSRLSNSVATVTGLAYTIGIWLKSTDGVSTYKVQLSLNGQNPVVVTVTPTWTRFSTTAPSAADTTRIFRMDVQGSAATTSQTADVLAWGGMHIQDTKLGAYIQTAGLAAGVTVTDYSATAAGVVTVGQAPVAGAALTWGGTGQTIANPTADATAAFPDDVYFIEQRTTETREVVEFQLAAAFDFQGLQLPRRPIIQNVCIWKYRGPECGYTGSNYDVNDNRIADTDSANDVCSKRLSGCQCRFGTSAPLPYGAFPAAGGIHV